MRILYISQYFPPESGATQTRAYEMARNLVRLGHQVTMIAEVPNHPSGIIPLEYRGKLIERTSMEGIDVVRVWVKASPVKSFRNRILFYLSFMFTSTLVGVFLTRGPYDLIYATSPPLFVGASGLLIGAVKRIPLIFEVRDLWPESAVALGELSNPLAIKWATWLEEACYTRAKKLVVVTQGIATRLIERGVPTDKVALISNGANTDMFQFKPEARSYIRARLGLEDKFIAIYAGIHGVAQGLETVVESAHLLRQYPQVHFLFVGDGPKKADLATLIQENDLSNLTLIPEQPRQMIPDYLSAADVALVPLRNLEVFKGALPSKIFDAWACQRPVLLSVAGEAREVLELCGGGLFIPPEDPAALRDGILACLSNPHLRETMGENGRRFTERYYSRQTLADKMSELLISVVAG